MTEEERLRLEPMKAKVLALFRDDRPLLIGVVCMSLKIPSLRESELLLEMMRDEGLIRLVSKEESRYFGISHGYLRA